MKIINHRPVGAALAFVLAAQLGLAGDALAATPKATKKKKKKAAARKVYKVRCATVTVRCQGGPGAQGPAGPAGHNGTNGANGYNGGQVITRARLANTPLVSTMSGVFPRLTGASWTQGPNEDDWLAGAITFTAPAACNASGNNGLSTGPELGVEIILDGQEIGYAYIQPTAGPGQTETDNLPLFQQDLAATGYSQDHQLTTRVTDDCGDAGDSHFSIRSLGINVAAFS